MYSKKIALILFFSVHVIYSQSRTRADRYFENEDFYKAIEYYSHKSQSKKVLENMGKSYYNTSQFQSAALKFKDLISGEHKEKDKSYENEFNFYYYQSLSSLGYYQVALKYLDLYKKKKGDSLNIDQSIEIIEDLKLKSPNYVVNKLKFNTENSEFGAVKKGREIIFISDQRKDNTSRKKFNWTKRNFLDIYKIPVTGNLSAVGKAESYSELFNTELHDGSFCFNDRGNVIYLTRSLLDENTEGVFDETKRNRVGIYMSVLSNNEWSEPRPMAFNDENYSCMHPALSPDGKRLYFSSDKAGGKGGFDIYYVNLFDTKLKMINAGGYINTIHKEQFPYISEDGHLFFSSDGHLGLGMMDIFVSEYIKGEFTIPLNLGSPVNSPFDDFNFNYYNSKRGLFASNRDGTDDLFEFYQTGNVLKREFDNKFILRDVDTNQPVKNSFVSLFNNNGEMIYNNRLDSLYSFSLNMRRGQYLLKVDNIIYETNEEKKVVLGLKNQHHIMYLKKKSDIDSLERQLAAKKIDTTSYKSIINRVKLLGDKDGPKVVYRKGKLVFDTKPIYFKYNSYELTDKSKVVLDELASKIGRYPNIHLKITAHTDSRGRSEYNQRLSEKRAEVTRNYLALEEFINARRMRFSGKGESEPVIPCNDDICDEKIHTQNRRCEFEIISY